LKPGYAKLPIWKKIKSSIFTRALAASNKKRYLDHPPEKSKELIDWMEN